MSSGSSTPSHGRRQLPQTPLTPRPAVAYRTANSSPVSSVGAQTTLPLPSPVMRISSEPYLRPQTTLLSPQQIVTLPPLSQHSLLGIPNGYHCIMGVTAGPGGSSDNIHRYYPEAEEEEWC